MNRIQTYIGQEIVWEKTAFFASEYQLSAGNQVLAKLAMSTWGRDARAEMMEGAITIEARGFFSKRYLIFATSTNVELAVYTPDWWSNSGTLQFAHGSTFNWGRAGFLSGEHVWTDVSGNVLIRCRSSFGGGKLYIIIEPAAVNIPELPFLPTLARYLETIRQRNSRIAASQIAASQ